MAITQPGAKLGRPGQEAEDQGEESDDYEVVRPVFCQRALVAFIHAKAMGDRWMMRVRMMEKTVTKTQETRMKR
jgi:hypothetical protein